ncbi:MAG: OB-fold domain-containing protein [Sphingomonadales bacterium]|nr:OB-fold domain-containing protein [Sphingomonadales bacterium]
MTAPPRKLPVLDDLSGFFWTSGADGVLRVQRCTACGHWQHPPLPSCAQCHADDLAPQPVSGRGRVKTFTINRQAWTPGMAPFTFAAIELDEQAELYLFSNVTGDPEAVRTGMAVEVTFEQQDDVWLPLFRPVEAAHG